MKTRQALQKHLGSLILITLFAPLIACGTLEVGIERTPTPDPAEATLAALATENAHLATQVAMLEATTAVKPSPTATPTRTPKPTTTSTRTPTPTATPTTRPQPTRQPPPPTATPTPEPLIIRSFTAEPMAAKPGGDVTLTWESTGGEWAAITPTDPLAPSMTVPSSGSIVVTVEGDKHHWQEFELVVSNAADETAYWSLSVEICPYEFFFTPAPEDWPRCPHKPACSSPAVEQRFEGGRMIWLKEVPAACSLSGDTEGPFIYVLYSDDQYPSWQRFLDTWTPAQPADDPTIVPPEGKYQPVRGFGKLWRNDTELQGRLGWALAPEQGFDGKYQITCDRFYDLADTYLLTIDGRIVDLVAYGWWEYVTP
jgi:hypothetical protein